MKKFVLLSFLSLGFAASIFISHQCTADQNTSTKLNIPQQPLPSLKLNDPLPANLFVELAKAINPAVVNISTSALPQQIQRDPMLDMLERFYGLPPQGGGGGWNNKPQRMGLGTGFIIREDGLILTNAHVIANADIIEVQLTEGSDKQYKAEIVGSDQRTDIALIKIKPEGKLPVVSLGSSKEVQVGEWVAAFGNPYGHGHTMTKGIISSKGRAIQEINKFPLLQTDASINPGNSGGPLVNSKGQVIGINSAIDARAQNIGFAIPIDDVKALLPQLENGRLKKGFLGVSPNDLDERVVEMLKLTDENRGSIILNVQPDSPAGRAGLKDYDVVIEIDGVKVKNAQHLVDIISDKEPSAKVKVKFYRDNNGKAIEKIATVTIAERPDEKKLLQNNFQRRQRR